MKGCCSVRLLSYIVAILHIVIYALASIVLVGSMVMYFRPEMHEGKGEDHERKMPFRRLVIAFLASFAALIFSIILIRGIQLNRARLISPFLICMAITIAINLGHEVISFIVSLVKKEPFTQVIVTFIVGCIVLGIEVALVVPVYKFYRKLEAKMLVAPPKPTDVNYLEQRPETLPGGQI